jgi:hypothetical protein
MELFFLYVVNWGIQKITITTAPGDDGKGGMVEDNAIFQKPLHYQHKNLWTGKRVENLIKLYVFCFCALHLVSLSLIFWCRWRFLFSGKVSFLCLLRVVFSSFICNCRGKVFKLSCDPRHKYEWQTPCVNCAAKKKL